MFNYVHVCININFTDDKANLKSINLTFAILKINNFKPLNNQLRSGWQWSHVAAG
jgi:hypothetical protein